MIIRFQIYNSIVVLCILGFQNTTVPHATLYNHGRLSGEPQAIRRNNLHQENLSRVPRWYLRTVQAKSCQPCSRNIRNFLGLSSFNSLSTRAAKSTHRTTSENSRNGPAATSSPLFYSLKEHIKTKNFFLVKVSLPNNALKFTIE
jgi:hypothetical protein